MKLYEKCIRCGRKLKSDESKELGFGKVCFEKWNSELNMKKLFSTDVSNKNSQNLSNENKEGD